MKKNIKIVVIGGSGLIGTKVVNNLRQRGHEVVAASPSSGVNTLTGEGLAEALNGAQIRTTAGVRLHKSEPSCMIFNHGVACEPSCHASTSD